MAKKKRKKFQIEPERMSPQVYIAGGCLLGVFGLLIGNSALSVQTKASPAEVTNNNENNLDLFMEGELLAEDSSEDDSIESKKREKKRCPPQATHFGMRCGNCEGITLEADYLYWKAQEDGLIYAIKIPGWQAKQNITHVNNVYLVEHSPNWGSGFRVGLGDNLPYDLWDLGFDWTYYNHRNTNHIHSDTNSIIAVTAVKLFNSTDTFTVSDASSAWHLRFSMMDLVMGRKFLFGDHFILRPSAGLKGGWINQTQSIQYSQLNTAAFGSLPHTRVKKINDFAGIGPELGIDMRWLLGHQFGIFGIMNTALLYGHFDIKTKFFFFDSPITNVPTLIDSKNRLRPALQLLLGLDWEKCFGGMKFGLGAGYELQYWWSQQQNFVDVFSLAVPSGGDLTMHGLTAKAKLEF
jgi:hypothetical protein